MGVSRILQGFEILEGLKRQTKKSASKRKRNFHTDEVAGGYPQTNNDLRKILTLSVNVVIVRFMNRIHSLALICRDP